MPKIDALQPGLVKQLSPQGVLENKKSETTKFSDTLGQLINQVDDLQKISGEATKEFLAGNGNLHEVMTAGEEAQLSFQLLMEIRNKLLDAYRELSRMPV